MSKTAKRLFLHADWQPAYETTPPEGDPPPGDPPPGDPLPGDPPKEGKTFTQEQVDEMLSGSKQNAKSALTELEALKTKVNLTQEERSNLNNTVEKLQNQLMTKEEQAKKALNKKSVEYQEQLEAATKSSDAWRSRYEEQAINTAIVKGCTQPGLEVFNADQIMSMLRPHTSIVEKTDKAGDRTGEFEVFVALKDVNDKKEEITLQLTPTDAVKHLFDKEEFANLFKGNGVGGLGMINANKGKDLDAKAIASGSHAEYVALRKSGDLKIM